MTNHHHLNSNTHLSSHEQGEGSHEQGHAAKVPLGERTTSLTSWADRVRVTDSTTRHTLEPIPQKPAGYRLKIPAGMPMLDTNQWSRCMIGFFTGCRLPYHAVNTIARKAWGSHGLEQTPKFQFDRSKISTVSVWIRLKELPLPLRTKQGLSLAASMVGKPQSCDDQTINCRRLDYARLCVELDANLPFIHHFEVESPLTEEPVKVTMEHEWKPARCETCRSFGHNCRHQGLETTREGKREPRDILQREERPMQREGKQIACDVSPMRSVPLLEPCLIRQQDSTIKQPTPNKQMSESSRQSGVGTEGLKHDIEFRHDKTLDNTNPPQPPDGEEVTSTEGENTSIPRKDEDGRTPLVGKKGGRKRREARGL
ncbi:GLYCINE-RICH CELL WALL STRUCTURAL PROTEIN 1.8-LIKE [Salix viminalis]|uniref:GLYCINE-RICH CELL WALL STRUCTURAL PROTEIN 1.8-LIKE n=1 Tax=Salix viminalis TaxID=40686 RepID=A0A6N2KNG7_SALVM|nr:GLYCINE-RICH CELL WALL STRUCTURAL PROTEIN 1.8-LIKE [Salix viminalis]